ncbi:type IV secretion protein Rhs [Aquabacterium sp. A7-Y]|uniref:RHS repeat-associated core domain-containing protein n=1 Tax=Aquabacterium sp. A7-Y TaxID=1349605 RepID=UPI00223CBAED|nr:RHS repeat-associated core domain-containing protein [Aquabacterium sp. A7-Y]MCW7537680.1 type IV secretion protein Rhs [Aquabacterium sp. A7-Y]
MRHPRHARPWAQRALVGALISAQVLPLSAWAQTTPTQDTTTQYEYDAEGNRTKITDPRAQVTIQRYDNLDRLKQQELPVPKAGAGTPLIDYSYDQRDQLTGVTDPKRNTTSYGVDGLGNPVNVISPDTGTTTITKVDAAGNVTELTNARGQKIVYVYDALNRPTTITWPSGAKTVHGYDAYSTTAGAENYGRGQLTSLTELTSGGVQTSRLEFAYDSRGRLLRRCQLWGAATTCTAADTLSYRWATSGTQAGRLLGLTYPSGRKVDYQYDAQGRIGGVTTTDPGGSTAQAVVSNVQYQTLDVGSYAVKSFTFGNGSTTPVQRYSRSFDLDGRITGFTLGQGAPGIGAEQAQYTLVYDPASRITEIRTGPAATPTKVTFSYDNLDRLTQAVLPSATYSYDYDLNGNRTQRIVSGAGASTTTYTYPATNNRLESVKVDAQPAQTLTTDTTGNITVDPANPLGTINYTYTTGEGLVVTGRLNVSYGPMARHVYSHNGLGQRIRKAGSTLTSNGVTYSPPAYVGNSDTYFHYDHGGQLIAERDANQLVKREYIWLGNQPVAVITGATPTQQIRTTGTPLNLPQVRYVHTDHLNTPRLITDSAGVKRWEWAVLNEPFGIAAANSAPQGQASTHRLDFHLRFPGQYFDQETAAAYNYFRSYNSHTGRYLQSDPLGLAGGLGTYSYAAGSPMRLTDAAGLSPAGDVGAIVGMWGGRIVGAAAGEVIWPAGGGFPGGLAGGRLGSWGGRATGEWLNGLIYSDASGSSTSNDQVCKPAKPDVEPGDLCEQLALAEAKAGAGVPIMGQMGDEPRLVAHYGAGPWRKMEHKHVCPNGRRITIHYFTNGRGLNVELKFK